MSGRSPFDAIALVASTGKRGTGFLVRAADLRLLVLTAGHLADAPSLEVTFAAHGFKSPARVARRGGAGSALLRGTSDWAALECEKKVPPEVFPIELDELDGPPLTPFETFGYPNLYGWSGKGGPLHGTVRRVPGGAIQPYCVELDGRPPSDAAGISGAPCVVADVAIGVIHQVLAQGNAVVGASLGVVPTSTIALESGGALAPATDPKLPYLPDTELPLEGLNPGMLARMAERLELDEIAGHQAATLRRRVARGLLVAPPEQVARALVSVKDVKAVRDAIVQLMVQRESLGIQSTTVQGALRLLDGGVRAAALNATLEVSARLLLRRVSWVRGYGDRWYSAANCLIVNPAQDSAAAVVSAVRKEAIARFRRPDPDPVLNQRVVFAAIFRTLPRPTTCAALAKEFKTLRVMFCSDPPPDPAASEPGAEWLASFTAGDEHEWRTTCLRARDHLRDNAALTFDDDHFDRMD
jgi:hypothetical protein